MTRTTPLATILTTSLGAALIFPAVFARATTGSPWIANGATACEKYLTPVVTAAILNAPPGHAQRTAPNSCSAHPIYITLKAASVPAFKQELPLIAGAHPIAGIVDAAYWNEAGAVSAVKGDRGCDISVIVPGSAKVTGADLAQKLGAICNQLFALP